MLLAMNTRFGISDYAGPDEVRIGLNAMDTGPRPSWVEIISKLINAHSIYYLCFQGNRSYFTEQQY